MRRVLLLLLLIAAPAPGPAQAQAPASAWRVVNRTGQVAVGLVATEAGAQAPRGRNRLRQPVPDGAEKGFRRKADSPCRLDLRLRLADGREAVLRGHDVCATPAAVFEPASVGAAPAPEPNARGAPPRRAGPSGPSLATGTGFLVAPDRVLTNRHVVERCAEIVLRAPDGHRFRAVPPVRASREADLAVLSVPGLPGPALAFREEPPRRGDGVVAFGFPYSDILSSDPKLTRGEVSALAGARDDRTMIQISAPLQPGNSGGPLLDMRGRVIGINTGGMRAAASRPVQNVNFAVRADQAVAFLRAAGVAPRLAAEAGPEMGTVAVGEIAGRSTYFIMCRIEGSGAPGRE